MASFGSGKLQIFHGGEFQRLSNLMYIDCECSEVDVDPDFLSVNDIEEIVSKSGYLEDKIQAVYFCMSDFPFEDSLVVIESDAKVRELIRLLTKLKYVCIYVKHIDDDKAEEGGGNKEGNEIEDDDYFANEDDEVTDGLWSEGDDVFYSMMMMVMMITMVMMMMMTMLYKKARTKKGS